MMRIIRLGLLALAAGLATPAAAQDCDRACLTDLVTTYVDALVARDPSRLPVTDNFKFTEDSRTIELGEGLWETVTAKTDFRQDYIDTAKQVAAAHVELREGEIPVLYSLVLHVEDREIAGIETLVQRITPDSPFQPTELDAPVRGFDELLPEGDRMPRELLVKTALTYADGLRIGNFTDARTPFADETYRVENGVITAGEGCLLDDCGLYSQRIMVHPSLLASVAAVDEEKGAVLLWMNFGYTDSYGPGNALVTYEAFKIRAGSIRSINAFFATLPINTPRAWPSLDPVD